MSISGVAVNHDDVLSRMVTLAVRYQRNAMYSHSAITTPGKPDSGNPHEVQGANTKGTAGAVDPDTVLSAGKTSARTFETDGDTDLATSSPKDVFHRTTARSTARARLPPRSEGCPRRRARWYLRTRESTGMWS